MAQPNLELTTAQRGALEAYHKHTERFGGPPTVRQLGAALGLGHNAAWTLIKKLEAKGYLKPRPVTVTRLGLSAKAKREL